ncbi:MAG: hypothetical protein ACTSUE_08885 [Promethearchaeota archaeon]
MTRSTFGMRDVMMMLVSGKPKKTLVPEHVKKGKVRNSQYQLRIDYILIGLKNPIRIEVLKFLKRSRDNGMQPFTSIAKALKGLNKDISTSRLGYHLKEMKKVKFILGGEKSGGYIITELGRKLLDVYFELEGIHDDIEILQANELVNHVYSDDILGLVSVTNTFPHVIDIRIDSGTGDGDETRDESDGGFNIDVEIDHGGTVPGPFMSGIDDGQVRKPAGKQKRKEPTNQSLDSFM